MMKEAKRSTVSGSAPQPIKSTPARAQSVDLLRLFRDQPRKEAGEARQALRHLADRHMHPLAVDGVPCRARAVVDGGDFKAAGRQAAARRFVAVGAYLVEQRRVDEARPPPQIGRAACRERVGQSSSFTVGPAAVKK